MYRLEKNNIDMKMFQIIFLTLLLPTIYRTIRINFLSNIPDDWGFNIASQLQWINLIFEVIQEALILPLFYFIGKSFEDTKETKEKIITSLFLNFLITLFFSLIISLNINFLTKFMMQKPELIIKTISYIKLELIGIILFILYKAMSIILIQRQKIKTILLILFIELLLTVVCDFVFIGNNNFGLGLGVNGIAYTNIIVKTILVCLSFNKILEIYNINFNKIHRYINLYSIKKLINVGSISGLESFVRNIAFMLMIIQMVNRIGKQGDFWLMMNFIWGWILLPILSLGEVIKSESSKNYNLDLKKYLKITSIIILIWIISMPFWRILLKTIMGLNGETLNSVLHLSYISVIFYVVFALNNIIDSYFYGIGRTDLMLYQSLIINIFYYGSLYLLFKFNIFIPNLINITIIFGVGMVIDSIFTFLQYLKLQTDREIVGL
ncbi:MAG: MATE family Na+-driven efflux transporter [Cetobacterium sp.]|uniref:MATE family Na+-driven efflux transporter n=1 Tax=Cetobacterium sp. TaxID=2071632 RepID=UPI003F3ED247